MPSPAEFDALTRIDFNVFVERVFAEVNGGMSYLDNFHIAAICAELEAVRRGEVLRLAIALPPRSLKSILVSVAYVAWLLGHDPSTKIICASYGQQLSEALARDCRKVMRSEWYRRLFPATRLTSSRAPAEELTTTAGGYRLATSVGGSITGKGADYFIVDDPTKPEEALSEVVRARANEWARHTLFTRHNDKVSGRIILVMQRLHQDDMIGHVAELTDLRVLSFPAIALANEHYAIRTPFGVRHHQRAEGEALHPAREPLNVLEGLRKALGSQFFTAQYLQMPAPPNGNYVDPGWFGSFDPANPPEFDEILQSWDTGSKDGKTSDYSVCTTWGRKGKQFYLLNVVRKRLTFPELRRAVVEQARLFDARTVIIEDCASGIALIQQLRDDGFHRLQAVKPRGSKVERLEAQTAVMEAGLVFLPASAAWKEDYLFELMLFPAGRHDDQVDSTSQALGWFANNNGPARWLAMMDEFYRERGRGSGPDS
jgi:predicted phage terminase large subunit-like protein